MKVVCLMREGRDYSREVWDWLGEFERRNGRKIEVLSPDEARGESLVRAYDLARMPVLIALDEERAREVWQGMPLPRIDEVAYYLMGERGLGGIGEIKAGEGVVKNTTVSRIGKTINLN